MDETMEEGAENTPIEVVIVPDFDLTCFVANTQKLHVSADVMREASTAFARALSPGSRDGDEFDAHKASNSNTPFLMLCPDDDAIGMKLYCAALHGRLDIISHHLEVDAASLVSFAITASKYNGLARVRKTAELCMQNIPFARNVQIILRASFCFEHAEYFGKLTDWMVKYWQASFDDIRGLVLEPTTSAENIYDLLRSSERRYLWDATSASLKVINPLMDFHGRSHDHNADRLLHRNLREGVQPGNCTLYQQAIATCQDAFVQRELRPRELATTHEYVSTSHNTPEQPDEVQEARSSDCDKAREVVKSFEEHLQKLKDVAKDSWAGVCLRCFKSGQDQRLCRHERFFAPCPYCEVMAPDTSPLVYDSVCGGPEVEDELE